MCIRDRSRPTSWTRRSARRTHRAFALNLERRSLFSPFSTRKIRELHRRAPLRDRHLTQRSRRRPRGCVVHVEVRNESLSQALHQSEGHHVIHPAVTATARFLPQLAPERVFVPGLVYTSPSPRDS